MYSASRRGGGGGAQVASSSAVVAAGAGAAAAGDSPLEQEADSPKVTPALVVSVAATLLGSFLVGYHLGVLNTSLSAISASLNFSLETVGVLLASIPLVGAIIGAGMLLWVWFKKGGNRGRLRQLFNQRTRD